MNKLDAEKIYFLKRTIAVTLIFLLLMFFVGKKYLNSTFDEDYDSGLFVTAFSGLLDLKTGIFHYVNAGHNPPLIRRHDFSVHRRHDRGG